MRSNIALVMIAFSMGWGLSRVYYYFVKPEPEPVKTEWKAVISGMDTTLTITDSARYKWYRITVTSEP